MPAIPQYLFPLLRQTLLDCAPLADYDRLRSLFDDDRLYPWRFSFPRGNSPETQVDLLIDALHNQRQAATHENALLLFLRVLQDRYDPRKDCFNRLNELVERLANGMNEKLPPAMVQPEANYGYLNPRNGERFLENSDRYWIVARLGELERFQDRYGRRNFLIESQIPDTWIGEIPLDHGGATEVARIIVNDLEIRGHLPKQPTVHPLGNLLKTMLVSLGYEHSVYAAVLIARYHLLREASVLTRLSEEYRLPLPANTGESYQLVKIPPKQLPINLSAQYLLKRMQALHHIGQQRWVDAAFLTEGAHAARAVCRLERRKDGVGTGLLLTSELVLTSFHVVCPPGIRDNIDTYIGGFEARFGAMRTPNGVNSQGKLVIGLRERPIVAWSEVDELDYILVRLRRPVPGMENIIPAKFSKEPIRVGEAANILQHPLGGPLKVTLRHNEILHVESQRFYYIADTEVGSSGAPVFNDEWDMIGLHRSAGLLDAEGHLVLEANEGVPISAIMKEIQPFL